MFTDHGSPLVYSED